MTPNKIPPLTEEEIKNLPAKPLVDLEKPFIDNRGSIQPLVDFNEKRSYDSLKSRFFKSKSLP